MTYSIFNKTKVPLLSRALDAYSLRHKAIASNIANVGTSGYQPQTVKFEEELSEALRANGMAMSGASPQEEQNLPRPKLESADDSTARGELFSGTNEVDIDHEMAQLAQNQIRFRYAAKLLGETFRGLQKSIRGTV